MTEQTEDIVIIPPTCTCVHVASRNRSWAQNPATRHHTQFKHHSGVIPTQLLHSAYPSPDPFCFSCGGSGKYIITKEVLDTIINQLG